MQRLDQRFLSSNHIERSFSLCSSASPARSLIRGHGTRLLRRQLVAGFVCPAFVVPNGGQNRIALRESWRGCFRRLAVCFSG